MKSYELSVVGQWRTSLARILRAALGILVSILLDDEAGPSSDSPDVAFGLVENTSPYKQVTAITL